MRWDIQRWLKGNYPNDDSSLLKASVAVFPGADLKCQRQFPGNVFFQVLSEKVASSQDLSCYLTKALCNGLCSPTVRKEGSGGGGHVGAETLPCKGSVSSNTDCRYRLEKMQTFPGGSQLVWTSGLHQL